MPHHANRFSSQHRRLDFGQFRLFLNPVARVLPESSSFFAFRANSSQNAPSCLPAGARGLQMKSRLTGCAAISVYDFK
jgi:hypothetical protein